MVHQVTFDSGKNPGGELVSLASGYVSANEITFAKENVVVNIDAKTGEVVFCDMAGNGLLTAKAKTPSVGDEKFSEVQCKAENGQIVLGFPEYTYKDNYPHCDGESDRWTKVISGYQYLRYNCKDNCVTED